MDESLNKLAKRASKDPSLMASFIARYGEREGLRWGEIASRLRIDSSQLARLALCRTPRQATFSDDIAHIADYTGMNRSTLTRFVQQRKAVQATPNLGARWKAVTEGLGAMFSYRTWAVGFAALVLLIVGAVAFAQPRATDATLVVSKGSATVTDAGTTVLAFNRTEKAVAAGDIISVSAGDKISLGSGSSAQLRLYDGSTVDISENTSLDVTDLYTTEDTYRVGLNMLTGKTVSRVLRLLGAGDAFRVSTPSSTASVRGTIFTVEVIDADTTHIAVDEGTVYVAMGSQQIDVVAGTEVTAVVGETLEVDVQTGVTPPDTPPFDPPLDPPPGDPPGPNVVPPGLGYPPPGHSGEIPGQSDVSPGNSGTAPGHTGDAPGNSGDAPGRSENPPPGLDGLEPGRPDTPPGRGEQPGNRPANDELPPRGGRPPGSHRNPHSTSADDPDGTTADGDLLIAGLPPGLAKKHWSKFYDGAIVRDHPHGGPPGIVDGNPPFDDGFPPGQADKDHPLDGGPPGQTGIKPDKPGKPDD
jgi:hypothetical protein